MRWTIALNGEQLIRADTRMNELVATLTGRRRLRQDVATVDQEERVNRGARARQLADALAGRDVAAVAVTFVDTSGITRVKGVPLRAFEEAATWGVGATPVFDAFGFDDSIAATPVANPAGDLRLMPDLNRVTPLAGQPGWAWAPADRWTQDAEPHTGCSRLLATRMFDRLAETGLTARAGFEVEFVLYRGTGLDPEPASHGPAYGMSRIIDVSDFSVELLGALEAQGIAIRQFHPEYSPGQFEISSAPETPVAAADTAVLLRITIRAVAARHGFRVSFAPAAFDPGVGNGGHLHISLWRDGRNLFSGGEHRFGLTEPASAFSAGILRRLPALLAVGAPSVASYLRLLPSRWAGAFGCWGLENREAALRLVTGSIGEWDKAANLEVKCFDQSANPYLVVASVLAAGMAGMAENAALPEPVQVDPASLSEQRRAELGIARLPTSLADSVRAFADEPALTEAFGPELTETVIAVRRAELDRFAGASNAEIIAATRWRY